MKKRFSRYWLAYCIFLFLCLVAGAAFLFYTYQVVSEFDAAQPERVAANVIDSFSDALKQESLPEALTFPEFGSAKFEGSNAVDLRKKYIETIAQGGTLTYRVKTGAGGDLSKVYTLYAGESPFATLTLCGSNSRNKLFFFSMANWEISSLEPILTASLYSFRVYLPEGIHAYFNGVEIGEDERIEDEGSVPTYEIRNLTTEPVIRLERADGTPVECQIERNVVTPILYHYAFSLPDTLSVTHNGTTLAGKESDAGHRSYDIRSMTEPDLVISDGFGNSLSYHGESELPLYRYTITLPETYRLSIGGIAVDPAAAARAPHPDAAQLAPYAPDVTLPDLLTWQITLLHEAATVSVTDSLDETSAYTLTDHTLEITQQAGLSELPEAFASQIDVMETAILWSKFMTGDLPGSPRGFPTIAPYLIRNSYYYRYAYAWATGIDITFVSVHTITSFTNKRLSNFVAYSDTCFSCDVYFEKNMRLYDSHGQGLFAGNRTDVFNSTIYFVYCDDTPENGQDDPHWAIAVMHDVIANEGSVAKQ